MPDREQILAGLANVASAGYWLAVAWHVVVAVAIAALAAGWRPSNRVAGVLLAAPLGSVSVMAWWSGNPFNGLVFAAIAVVLALLALVRGDRDPVSPGPWWSKIVGGALVAFGWAYPHFLGGRSPAHYLFAAPLGLVPCPTLSAVCGAAIAARGLGSRAWAWTLATVAFFYAAFGVVRLGVWIDVALLVAALALALPAARTPRRGAP